MFKRTLKIVLFGVLVLLVISVGMYITSPDGSEFARKNPKSTSLIVHRERVAKKQHRKLGRYWVWVPLNSVSSNLIHTVIISEDARFYSHPGFDVEAIKFAAQKDLKRKKFAVGGSTITQQLAKNLYLSNRKSLFRKLREIIIAYKMDKKLTKHRILELYLNVIECGRGIYGVEAASRHYFGKSSSALSVDEACRLAVILPSPIRHSPYDGSRFVERRRLRLLKWEFKTGRIDSTAYQILTGITFEKMPDSLNTQDSLGTLVDSTTEELSKESEIDLPLSVEKLYAEPEADTVRTNR
ncbi:MAG: monofunctional biosynthetic peptidoglycan transglycosylase [Candidatus Marinimicrobia bacterium CG08_land_8_20_14_0_20_45_22]|nr:MAG: monofunctional biosynthetic peptidoglycan transglycosylase [Candidatus Marinimicrobia bacterium CG08_land_8_20_14_0_20_45_22]